MKKITSLPALFLYLFCLPSLLKAAETPHHHKKLADHSSVSSGRSITTTAGISQGFTPMGKDVDEEGDIVFELPYFGIPASQGSATPYQRNAQESLTIPTLNDEQDTPTLERERSPSPTLRLRERNSDKIMEEENIGGKGNQRKLKQMGKRNDKYNLETELSKTREEFQHFKKGAACSMASLLSLIIALSTALAVKEC